MAESESAGLFDLGTLKGKQKKKQQQTVLNHLKKFFEQNPEVINSKPNLESCNAEDIDDGILGKFATWLPSNSKVSKYSAHDQYVSCFHGILEEVPRFRTKVHEWTNYYTNLR